MHASLPQWTPVTPAHALTSHACTRIYHTLARITLAPCSTRLAGALVRNRQNTPDTLAAIHSPKITHAQAHSREEKKTYRDGRFFLCLTIRSVHNNSRLSGHVLLRICVCMCVCVCPRVLYGIKMSNALRLSD